MLAYAVAGVGIAVGAIGGVILIAPAPVRTLMQSLHSPRAIYATIGVRLAIGAFFVFASDACRWPAAIGTLGVVVLAAGFAGVFVGVGRVRLLLRWFNRLPDAVWRLLSALAIVFGAFVVYAAL